MQEKFTNNGEIQIQYLIVNHSPDKIPLIIIPGAMVSAEDFYNDVIDHLSFYCIIISVRGLGKSSAPLNGYSKAHLIADVEAVVVEEELKEFYILGHSFGASIASAYSLKYSQKVKGLILADYPPGYPEYSSEWAQMIRKNNPSVSENLVNGLLNESIHEMFTEALAKCGFNILILKGGNEDSLLKIGFVNKIIKKLPNSSLKIIDNCGHEMFIEKPKEVLKEIKYFIGA
ncbi:MAG: alpha/beta hydrolase [Chlorobi bacterium]|nr:alpha/beta hydrolase [Chlorobiota bacterium]MCI0716733.1 alpha/beta hydrolase [Chlorobiota bacterium]